MKKTILLLILILNHLVFSQKMGEYQLFHWEKNTSFYYSQIPESGVVLKKDLRKYFVFTTNLSVNNQVGNLVDTLRSRIGLSPVSKKSWSSFSRKGRDGFLMSFSDSLGSPVILRTISSGGGCDTCAKSLVDLLLEDQFIRTIILGSGLKKFSLSYYQMGLNRKWHSSFIELCWISDWCKEYLWIELPADPKSDSGQ